MNIVYYSGTGGTERVAKAFEVSLIKVGYTVKLNRLVDKPSFSLEVNVPLLLLYPVHAFNAPELVYKWIDSLDVMETVSAFVVSVSGGGEIIPNTACRSRVIKKLGKKGYKVAYEKMFVMPSNIVVATKEPLAKMLLDVLPKRVEAVIEDIEKGIVIRTKPYIIDRFFSQVGRGEKFGARLFGKKIKVSDSCTGCGWCVVNCPAGNIKMKAGKPTFGGECQLCLGCIYGCPSKALEAGVLKKFVIKEGYDLDNLESKQISDSEVDVQGLTKGYIWSGLRKYLLEDK